MKKIEKIEINLLQDHKCKQLLTGISILSKINTDINIDLHSSYEFIIYGVDENIEFNLIDTLYQNGWTYKDNSTWCFVI